MSINLTIAVPLETFHAVRQAEQTNIIDLPDGVANEVVVKTFEAVVEAVKAFPCVSRWVEDSPTSKTTSCILDTMSALLITSLTWRCARTHTHHSGLSSIRDCILDFRCYNSTVYPFVDLKYSLTLLSVAL